MKVTILETKEMAIKIKGLMDNYDEYYWAVAWASSKTGLADELVQRKNKIKQIVVGIDFDQTDPDFLDMMTSVSRSRVAGYPSGGTFHPKVYYFQSQRRAAAIVGSANFTRGGTELNVEVSILIEGKPEDEQLISLRNIVNKLWKRGEKITHKFVGRYRERHNLNHYIRRRLSEKFVLEKEAANRDGNHTQLVESSKLKDLIEDKLLQSSKKSPLGYHAFQYAREQLAENACIPDNAGFIEYFQKDIVKKSFVKQPTPTKRQIGGRAEKVRRRVRTFCKDQKWSDEEIRSLNVNPDGRTR